MATVGPPPEPPAGRRRFLRRPRWRPPRVPGGLALRLLALNVLLVFLPAAGILLLDTYEERLLVAQERSMVQQGRVLAAALAEPGPIDADRARAILARLEQRLTARLRVLGSDGRLIADSAQLGPRRVQEPTVAALPASRELPVAGDAPDALEPVDGEPDPRASLLYRLGAFGVRSAQRLLARVGLAAPPGRTPTIDLYDPALPFDGPEVEAALAGRYGAITRQSPGQRSVTLFCALPIRPPVAGDGEDGAVAGVVLVSQSTLRLLGDLYETRLAIVRVVVASLFVALVLSLMVSTTIVRPLAELRRQAAVLLDRRGRLRGRFRGSTRRDEIGDLARALEALSGRLGDHLAFIESFAADVSHELKNPLAAVRSATQMLAEVETPQERRRFLAIAEREIARLERLIGAVREVSLLDTRLEDEAREPVALGTLVARVVAGWQTRCPPGVELVAVDDAGGAAVAVLASADRLVQVLDNLLDNALSLAPHGSAVEVAWGIDRGSGATSATSRGEVWIEVRDRGPGIPPEHLTKVFDRFFTWRPGQPGARSLHSGLGLSIVKAIVEGYGGTVQAENRSGGGACFRLRLPLVFG